MHDESQSESHRKGENLFTLIIAGLSTEPLIKDGGTFAM